MRELNKWAMSLARAIHAICQQKIMQPDCSLMVVERNGFMSDQNTKQNDVSPKQSVAAIIGAVLGLISLFLSIIAGVPAVILGFFALLNISQSGGKLAGKGLAIFALATGGISIVFFIINRTH